MSTPETAMAANGSDNTERAEPNFVDINDPNFIEGELEGFDDEKDPLAFAVVRAGTYDAELNFSEQDPAKQWTQRTDKSNHPYLSTRLTARILDGPFANRLVNDGFVSTMVFDGTCAVAKVIKAIGGEVKGLRTSADLARKLSQSLPARARIRVQVRAQEKGVAKAFIKAEKDFPQKDDGTPDFDKVANSEGPETGDQVYVRSEITGYMEVKHED
ncbi:MAG TPA: hypothetical protein VL866_24445 [Pyrinomonadaceae bacterium]|nr:hypothetical protein [Pyrinomonadaceae bacterium]